MKYTIEIMRNFHVRKGFYTPGVYRVPEDIPEDLVPEAVRHGARKIMPVYETKAPVKKKTGGLTGQESESSSPPAAPASKKRTYTRRKAEPKSS